MAISRLSRLHRHAFKLVLSAAIWASTHIALMPAADAVEWVRYLPPSAMLSVDLPADIFTVDTGPVNENAGHSFQTSDRRADFSVYSKPNRPAMSPNAFLSRYFELPQSSVVYRRVTNRILVVSGYREDKIWYARCNFAANINCIQLNYPRNEKKLWDPIVTRISNSLSSRDF